jgi:arylsulfatase A-like enzyme
VPLVIKLPQRSTLLPKLAKLEHSSIRQIDIMPTVLELLDEGSLSGADGVSLLQDADRTLLAEVHPPEAPNSSFCVRDDRYKLVYTSGTARFALYDVLADTLEADDVFELQGHFRSAWQTDLKRLASASSHEVNQRMGLAEQRPAHLQSLGD